MTRSFLFTMLLLSMLGAKAQKIDSIYVNLYTDSLKKGTHNYINIDGLLHNGRYLPLDSTHIQFSASEGKFVGNSLVVDNNTTAEKITIRAVLRSNPVMFKEFTVWIKKTESGERLKTTEEILRDIQNGAKKKKKNQL